MAVDSQRREPLELVRTPSGQSRIRLRATSTIVLNGGAVAVGSQRREPLEPVRTPTGQSRSDGISAATGQNLLEVAARLSLVVWEAYYSPPALSLKQPAARAAGMGLPSLSGLRKCSSDWFKHVAQDKCFMYQVMESMRLNKPLERQHRPLS